MLKNAHKADKWVMLAHGVGGERIKVEILNLLKHSFAHSLITDDDEAAIRKKDASPS